MGYPRDLRTLATAIDVAELPSEFRIFSAGVNESTKGPTLFDATAAALAMSAYQRWGVDLMIDLEHAAFEPDARALRDNATDAMGWFNLELRGGELWAVNVRWTDAGAERVRSRRQRYISPAFRETKQGRVRELLNVALVSMPATLNAQPLIAASIFAGAARIKKRSYMDPEQIKAAIAAVKEGNAEAALTILEEMIAAAAGAAPSAPPEGEGLEQEPDMTEAKELSVALRAFTGLTKATEIAAEFRRLSATVETIKAERDALDLETKRELVGELVTLGAELPATAWEGDPEKRVPVKRLSAEPVADMRKRVAALRAAAPPPAPIRPPEGVTVDGLDDGDRARMLSMNDEQKARYVALRQLRVS